jgi:hypothetical protein
MSWEIVTKELQQIYQDESGEISAGARFDETCLQRWMALTGNSRFQLYERFGEYLARGFHAGDLSFAFCDAIVNDGFGLIVCNEEVFADMGFPPLFWETYLAFDSGEFYPHNDRSKDPVELYTRPLVAKIVAKLDGN